MIGICEQGSAYAENEEVTDVLDMRNYSVSFKFPETRCDSFISILTVTVLLLQ